jgi:pyridoxal phosphate enzyme (YggS family)
MGIEDKYLDVLGRIRDSAACVGKSVSDIELVAVTKTVLVDQLLEAWSLGLKVFGENRVQEAQKKYTMLPEDISWHLVGHLQTNKAKQAVDMFDLIHSVDSIRLAEEISKRAAQICKIQDVLVQVNTSGEISKSGIDLKDAVAFVKEVSAFSNIRVKGLMTIGPLDVGVQETRKCFRLLKVLYDELSGQETEHLQMQYLSMGMTQDFEIAIEEGSNMVRIGSGIFGARTNSKM